MSLYGGVELVGRPDLENVRKLDLLPLPQIARMERVGIGIDLDYLARVGSDFDSLMAKYQREISNYIPQEALDQFVSGDLDEDGESSIEINANSAQQIRQLLFSLLNISSEGLKQTDAGLVSTGKKNLEMRRSDHEVVPLVLAYREVSKLKSFCKSLPKFAKFHNQGECLVCERHHANAHHRLHGQILTTRAETGRLSMKKPNLQQIPKRSKLGRRIRAAFIAPPGRRLVSVDFSQMELRDLAHLANASSMIQVYWDNQDIHTFTACRAFGKDYDHYADLAFREQSLTGTEKLDWEDFAANMRLPSKNLNFMIVYGASWKGLQAQLALSGIYWDEATCKDFIQRWFGLYPEVNDYLNTQEYRARRYGCVWTPCGRIRLVPEIRSCHPYKRSEGVRQAGNMPVQGANAEQTKLVMGELEEEYEHMRAAGIDVEALLPIHDEIISETDEEQAEVIGDSIIAPVFRNVMVDKQTGENLWRVPINADAKVSERWAKVA